MNKEKFKTNLINKGTYQYGARELIVNKKQLESY